VSDRIQTAEVHDQMASTVPAAKAAPYQAASGDHCAPGTNSITAANLTAAKGQIMDTLIYVVLPITWYLLKVAAGIAIIWAFAVLVLL